MGKLNLFLNVARAQEDKFRVATRVEFGLPPEPENRPGFLSDLARALVLLPGPPSAALSQLPPLLAWPPSVNSPIVPEA